MLTRLQRKSYTRTKQFAIAIAITIAAATARVLKRHSGVCVQQDDWMQSLCQKKTEENETHWSTTWIDERQKRNKTVWYGTILYWIVSM